MEQAPIMDGEASHEDVAQEEERTKEEMIASMEQAFRDFYREDPEAFEEAYQRVKRNTEMQ